MFIGVLCLLSACYHVCWCQYDLINVVPGTRMSVNDDLFVTASNAFSNFAVLMHPFRNTSVGGPVLCNMKYNPTDRFVHSVAVVGITKNSTNADQFMFIFVAEEMSTMTPIVCIGMITKSTCAPTYACTNVASAGLHQEYFLIVVDTNGTFAYGFTSSFVFKLDIYANKIVTNLTTNDIWPDHGFIPRAIDITDTWAVVTGYGYIAQQFHKPYGVYACLIDLSQLVNASCISVTSEPSYLVPSNLMTYDELYELSVTIRGQKILVGVHRLLSVIMLCNIGSSLRFTHTYDLSFISSSSIGRVVAWADETTIAILVEDPFETSWSTTQIFFYNENSVSMTSPLFTFPNHQQVLGSRLLCPSFARFGISRNGNMAILTSSKADVIIIPRASAGYASQWIDTTQRTYVFYFEPRVCIGGTYKNRSSLGPCQICPSGTRNSGTSSYGVDQCMPCSTNSSNSFCPLAALADIDLTTVPSYSQAVTYPVTADATNIEDLLIKNVFQIGTNKHCLLISPLLWTIIVSSLCLLFVICMLVTNLAKCKFWMTYNQKAKIVFKHMDIIGEGELWFGGLATLAIAVLIGFSYWFSASFIKLYPIENVLQPALFACDETMVNAQFSTGLELLAIPKAKDAQRMFDFLDKQIFNLTVELINTGFPCSSVTVQENRLASKYVPLIIGCKQSIETATTSVTFAFPRHLTTVQINMTGPYWIGAIRLCIRGQGQTNASTTLRELDFCQFYATSNAVIGRYTSIPIVFVKNINMTQALNPSDPTVYSGLWMPTFTDVSLSDEDYYVEFGNYLRYTSSMTILQITLDERPFYIKNFQQPIVRTAELVFHDLLFASLCIELFALAFLLIKLVIIPICQWLGHLWNKSPHQCVDFHHYGAFLGRLCGPKSSNKITSLTLDTLPSVEMQEKEDSKCAPFEIELDSTAADTTV